MNPILSNQIDPFIKSPEFSGFPKGVSVKVLFYLEFQDLMQCLCVSKSWKRLASNEVLWKPLLDLCEKNKIPIPDGKVWTLIVTSPIPLRKRIKKICRQLLPQQKVEFKCYFLYQKAHALVIELKCQQDSNPEIKETTTENCIFLHTDREKNKSIHPKFASCYYGSTAKTHSVDWRKGDCFGPFGNVFSQRKKPSNLILLTKKERITIFARFEYDCALNGTDLLLKWLIREKAEKLNTSLKILEALRTEVLNVALDAAVVLAIGMAVTGDRTLCQLAALTSTFLLTKYFK